MMESLVHPRMYTWDVGRQGDGSEDYLFRRTLLPHIDAALQGGRIQDPILLRGWGLYTAKAEGGKES